MNGIKDNNDSKDTDILSKIQHYCSYRERCLQEVTSKLKELGVCEKKTAKYLDQLIDDNFIDERRYAEVYARGKFRINKWGRIKIRKELRLRNIPENLIQLGLDEIEDAGYYDTLKKLILKKSAPLKNKNSYEKDQKLAAYAISKGYENDIVWNVIRNMDKDIE